jgi:hypothetical protein
MYCFQPGFAALLLWYVMGAVKVNAYLKKPKMGGLQIFSANRNPQVCELNNLLDLRTFR